jgi:hypothetical protein
VLPDNERWMHDGDVSITFEMFEADDGRPTAIGVDDDVPLPPGEGAPPSRVWLVDVDDSTVIIILSAPPGVPHEELAAAVAIIDSIQSEPSAAGTGRLLTFTLPGGWDSG